MKHHLLVVGSVILIFWGVLYSLKYGPHAAEEPFRLIDVLLGELENIMRN